MENKLAVNALSPVPGIAPAPSAPAPASDAIRVQNDVADLRLVIEEDRASGLFIYKTIDRRTGDVVQQLPREEVVRMHAAQGYAAGALIKARV